MNTLIWTLVACFVPVAGADEIRLANSRGAYTFDGGSGSLSKMELTEPHAEYSVDPDVAAPLAMWAGEAEGTAERRVVLNRHQRLTRRRTAGDTGFQQLILEWDDLLDESGKPTGMALELRYRLDENDTFLRIHTHMWNRGNRQMRGLFLGLEDMRLAEDPQSETLGSPAGHAWFVKRSPRTSLEGKAKAFSMYSNWFDYSTASGRPSGGWGIATGYLNRKSMDMVARVIPNGQTSLALGWQFFRLEEAWPFMEPIRPPPQVYPLRPGEDFASDEWFLGLHTGGWQAAARYYRNRYEEVFSGDFLPWESVSPAVRNADVMLTFRFAWGKLGPDGKKHDLSQGELFVPFREAPGKVEKMLADLDLQPEHALLAAIGQGTHWGIYKLPDYFPPCAEAGGEAGFREMVAALRDRIKLAGSHYYIHTAFNHPDADSYVRAADTGWEANLYADYTHLGRIACKAVPAWFDLWQAHIIPSFVRCGVKGLEVDEGFGHHFICDQPDHGHALDSETVLTAQPNGALRIFREWRKQAGPGAYLECEGGNDVEARLFDLWETAAPGPMSAIRYTHPDKMISCWPKNGSDVLEALVYGMPVFYVLNNPVYPEYRTFTRLRRELRERSAPGYPQGYRETDGIIACPDAVMAKAFAGVQGITVVYFAKEAASGEIAIDPRALGFDGAIVRRHLGTLGAHEAGYWIIAKSSLRTVDG